MIHEFLTQTVTIERRTAVDQYSQGTYSTSTASARVELRTRMLRDAEGREKMAEAVVFLAAGTQIETGDRVSYLAESYEVMAVSRAQGLDAEDHVVAYLGRPS